MKRIFLALLLITGALLLNAAEVTLRNNSKKRLSLTRQDGAYFMVFKDTKGYDAEASYRVKGLKPNTVYEFSCDIDSPVRNAVYLQAKLFKNGKPTGRPDIPANRKNKERLRIDFNTFDADTVQLNVRIYSRPVFKDKKIKVSNLYFGAPTEKKAEKAARLETVPGFNAASIYLNNNKSERAADCKAEVKYRKNGSSKWIDGLDLVYDESRKQFRGSLLGLSENTKYDFIIAINDNGKNETLKGSFVTRNSNFPIKKSIVLTAENASKLLKNLEYGSADGYIRYTSAPGTVLDFGVKQECAIDLTGAQYIILDSLTIKGGLRHGINVECANDIVIRNCDISGYGRVGKQDHHRDGKYFIGKRSINYDAGVNIQASERITVEKCFIHDPLSTANSWFYSHPAGPTAVYIGDAASVVLRYNDFIGSDKHRWNDAIEGWGNGSLNGSVKADAEIYGNYLAFGNDDGMEMDGGQMNCRFAYNKSEGLLCGFSTAPCLIGPGYHYRNLVHRGGDEFDFVGVGVKNNYSTGGRGALFFFNNTVLDHGNGFSSPSFNAKEQKLHKEKYLKVFSRNNMVRSTGELYGKGVFRPQYYHTSVDNDIYEGTPEVLPLLRKMGQAENSVAAELKFNNEKYGDYTPAADSPALGIGVNIPGVAEDESVTAGALQKQGDQLPLRYAPFSLNRTVVLLEMSSDKVEQAVVTLTPAKGCKGKFRIIQPRGADFFSVTPSSGTFDGKPVKLVVRTVPGKIKAARRNTSAFAVKMCDGWSRPVSVEVDSRANAELLAKARKGVIRGSVTGSGKVQTLTVNVPKAGYYWLFVKCPGKRAYVTTQINGGKPEKRMVHCPRYNKNPWCVFSTTIYQGVPNRPVKLKAGKNTVMVKSDITRITDFAVTANADDLRLAPDDL
ncbi:MAG: right-handed parallel beta-helix repeat-containing protein [Lentisphaeria bacterium]|nr:right-handed parallel beta-helix repeat-containing protein [Lentisphaeria bacterium]